MLQLHCSTLPSRFISFFKYFRHPLGVPWIKYHGYYEDLHINVVYPGKDRDLGAYFITGIILSYMCT
ncbi:putative methylthioadenosine nucleosidase [Helianthus annuus]|nr:putative methylthioadenosine nucleosidase [Helianthus annuus]